MTHGGLKHGRIDLGGDDLRLEELGLGERCSLRAEDEAVAVTNHPGPVGFHDVGTDDDDLELAGQPDVAGAPTYDGRPRCWRRSRCSAE